MNRINRAIHSIFIIAVLLIFSIFIYILYFINHNSTISIIGTIMLVIVCSISFYFMFRQPVSATFKQQEDIIRKFVLITRDGEAEKEWFCQGVASFLIGKGTVGGDVDIDLSDTYYAQLISNEHAVLNLSDRYWYIEDLASLNGVGIKKQGEDYSLRLKPYVSYKVDEGDIIYIAKAKILVR